MSNSRKSFLTVLPCALLVSCFGTAGSADDGTGTGVTLFIDRGNNTGKADGSAEHPFVSIQDALDTILGGEVLQVAAGTYEEPLVVSADIQMIGAGAASTILISDDMTPVITLGNQVTSFHGEGLALTRGFSSTGGAVNGSGVALSFRECIFRDNATGDEDDGDEATNAAIVRSQNSGSLVLERCVFLNNSATAVTVSEPTSASIDNCVIAMSDGYGIFVRGRDDTQDADVTITNVTVSGSSRDAIFLARFGDGVVRNGIQSVNTNGLFESQFAGDPLVFYNDLQDGYGDADTGQTSPDPDFLNGLDPPGTNVGNINADPLFLDPAAGDYRLQAGSPCIDTGDPSVLDVDGSRSDMGAFGGPGGNFDATFATALGTGFHPESAHHHDLGALLERDPTVAREGQAHPTDLDLDGRPDRLVLRDRQLVWWVDRRGRGPRPAPLPPGLGPLRRATTYDVDGDGILDLIVEDPAGRRDLHLGRGRDRGSFAVHARPGDRVVAVAGAARHERVVLGGRGDRDDGALLFGLGRATRAHVVVRRGARTVLDAWAVRDDVLRALSGAGAEVDR